MSNFSNEVLRLTIDKLKNKVENTLFQISIVLGDSKNTKAVEDLEPLLYELDKYSGAINQARNLESQLNKEDELSELVKQRIDLLRKTSEQENNDDTKLEE